MTVRAKMKCTAKAFDGVAPNVHCSLSFQAVYADSEENKTWSKWTPSAHLSMTITNPAAFERFEEGKEYFVDFTDVPAEVENAGAA